MDTAHRREYYSFRNDRDYDDNMVLFIESLLVRRSFVYLF